MTNTLVRQAELDRIKTALFHAGELIAFESLVASAVFPVHILNILHRLPAIVARIKNLVVAVETAAHTFFEAERKVVAQVANSRTGVMEVAATLLAPLARAAIGGGTAWVKPDGVMSGQTPALNTSELACRLVEVSERTNPTIRIETFPLGSQPDAGRRIVVYVPGTRAFLGGPLDMRTNVLELAGQRSPVEVAVELGLNRVHAGAGDRVMVVGHSLGGMVAVSLADRSGQGLVPYRVDKVVEFGAPVGRHSPISGLKMLSVDGNGDFVPLLDGLGVPHWKGSSLVQLKQGLNPVENHAIKSYLEELQAGPDDTSWQRFGSTQGRPGQAHYFEFGVSGVPW